jgi:hypothetical protein
MFLANIEISHPGATDLLKRGAISVARSFVPGNRCPVDTTIEETFMKHSKSHGGALGDEMSLLFNADSNEALSGSSTRVFSNSKESYGRPIIGLSSPTEKQNYVDCFEKLLHKGATS